MSIFVSFGELQTQFYRSFGKIHCHLLHQIAFIVLPVLTPNRIYRTAILLLSLKDYERQKKQGVEPKFDPKALGIEGVEYWITQ